MKKILAVLTEDQREAIRVACREAIHRDHEAHCFDDSGKRALLESALDSLYPYPQTKEAKDQLGFTIVEADWMRPGEIMMVGRHNAVSAIPQGSGGYKIVSIPMAEVRVLLKEEEGAA